MTLLQELRSKLQSAEGSIEDACRRALLLVLDVEHLEVEPPVVASIDSCPACFATVASERSPYCGPKCREESGFVRQVRAGLADGSILEVERQVALGQVLWSLLGGGYPLRQTLILERSRAQVFKRSGGRCEVCGSPASALDHITTACNRPINLRAVCEKCSRTRTFGDASFLAEPAVKETLMSLSVRVAAPRPLRVCDDPESWDWRAYVAARKALGRLGGPSVGNEPVKEPAI